MFEQLFRLPVVQARHRNGPLADERARFLQYRADQGAAINTLAHNAASLMAIAQRLNVEADRGVTEEQIRHADKSYELSASRLKESIKGRSPSEVLMAIRTLGGARLQYIQTVRDLNKAQIRLLVLSGAACGESRP